MQTRLTPLPLLARPFRHAQLDDPALESLNAGQVMQARAPKYVKVPAGHALHDQAVEGRAVGPDVGRLVGVKDG